MPSTTQPQDLRVWKTVSLSDSDRRPRMGLPAATLTRCQSACCVSPSRPEFTRSAGSFVSPYSDKSAYYSTGTDGEGVKQSDDGSMVDFGDVIDSATFEQILEMDDDEEEREFSKSIVYDFFDQAKKTFKEMHASLEKKDLATLSSLGHFLKGSSATLGLTKVKDSCEKIQHFGAKMDETGSHPEPDDEKSLSRCRTTILAAEGEFKEAEVLLRKYYHDDGTSA